MKRDNIHINYEWIQSEDPYAEETLILIHGTGLDMHSWDFVIPYFRKHYDVVVYDLRGHGDSDAGEQKRTVEILSEDLKYLLSELDIQNYHFIAQGFGGLVAVYLAAQDEEVKQRLRSLILFSVPFHYPKKLGDKVINQRKEFVNGQRNVLEMGKKLVNNICYDLTEDKEKILLHAFEKVSPEVYFDLFHTKDLHHAIMYLQKVDKPILILSGSEDEVFPPELNSASLNFNPNARYYTVPFASFLIQMDQPEITSEWIHNFIEKQNNNQRNVSENNYQEELTSEMYSEIRGMFSEKREHYNELHVHIMNGFGVVVNGERIHEGWGKRKAKQILVYLILQQSVTRDELCDIFWPEVDLIHARNRLRVALHHLKHLLEADRKTSASILVTEREHVFLQGKVKSDLHSHLEAIENAQLLEDDNQKAMQYKKILAEITDNPLPGLYEEWFLNKRNCIEEKWGDMSIFLADWYEKQGKMKNTLYYLKTALKYKIDDFHLNERVNILEQRMV
ncbi:alpha/beta fold hydrolase [Ornithinibacillus salinisoli]|uniref:Alpha/beta fold hydrolase n=1 Tax=Ornithinibacillus salinisoli TaxID=1848459 RepID=A0ABW4VZR6_9BACI